jgi:hypothetical protein
VPLKIYYLFLFLFYSCRHLAFSSLLCHLFSERSGCRISTCTGCRFGSFVQNSYISLFFSLPESPQTFRLLFSSSHVCIYFIFHLLRYTPSSVNNSICCGGGSVTVGSLSTVLCSDSTQAWPWSHVMLHNSLNLQVSEYLYIVLECGPSRISSTRAHP